MVKKVRKVPYALLATVAAAIGLFRHAVFINIFEHYRVLMASWTVIFILALTTLRCGADIFERLGLASTGSATPRADVATVRLAVLEIDARSGNVVAVVNGPPLSLRLLTHPAVHQNA